MAVSKANGVVLADIGPALRFDEFHRDLAGIGEPVFAA